jgi:transposase
MLWQRGKAYSQDLRERVFAAADAGTRVGQIAAMLQVSVAYVSKALSRRARTGETAARPQRCHLPPKLEGLYGAIRARVAERPDATIAELRAWLLAEHGASASTGLVASTLAKLDLTYKKTAPGGGAGPARRGRGARGLAGPAAGPGAGPAGVPR